MSPRCLAPGRAALVAEARSPVTGPPPVVLLLPKGPPFLTWPADPLPTLGWVTTWKQLTRAQTLGAFEKTWLSKDHLPSRWGNWHQCRAWDLWKTLHTQLHLHPLRISFLQALWAPPRLRPLAPVGWAPTRFDAVSPPLFSVRKKGGHRHWSSRACSTHTRINWPTSSPGFCWEFKPHQLLSETSSSGMLWLCSRDTPMHQMAVGIQKWRYEKAFNITKCKSTILLILVWVSDTHNRSCKKITEAKDKSLCLVQERVGDLHLCLCNVAADAEEPAVWQDHGGCNQVEQSPWECLRPANRMTYRDRGKVRLPCIRAMKEFLETLLKVEIVRVGICSLEFRIHGVHEYAEHHWVLLVLICVWRTVYHAERSHECCHYKRCVSWRADLHKSLAKNSGDCTKLLFFCLQDRLFYKGKIVRFGSSQKLIRIMKMKTPGRPSTPLRLSTHIWPMMEFCYSATAIPLAYGRQVIIISMTSLLCLSIWTFFWQESGRWPSSGRVHFIVLLRLWTGPPRNNNNNRPRHGSSYVSFFFWQFRCRG